MKVLLLSERDFALVQSKVNRELHCASLEVLLCKAWEKRHNAHWIGRVHLRKRAIEAARLKRIISQ